MIILLPSKITVIKWSSLTFVVYCRHWRMHQQLSQVWSKRCLSEYRGLIHLHLQSWILWILLILFYSIPKYNNYNNGHSRSSFWQLIRHIEYLLIAHLVSYRLLLCSVLTTCPSVGLNLSYIAIRQNKVIKNYQHIINLVRLHWLLRLSFVFSVIRYWWMQQQNPYLWCECSL